MWIVKGSKGEDEIELISTKESNGILPIGSFLTIESEGVRHIVRVAKSGQSETYSPSPLIIEMDLSPLEPDQKCQNIITANRIKDIPETERGLIPFVKPQTKARLSTQEEIRLAFGSNKGIPVFPATVFAQTNSLMETKSGEPVSVPIPEEFFFYQTMIYGKTGSGKTAAMKYLAQYFVNQMGGAVLAINVKEEDLLHMDKKSATKNNKIKREWDALNLKPEGIENFRIYHPGNKKTKYSKNVDISACEGITIHARNTDPDSLIGLLRNITETAALNLPSIFRYWKERRSKNEDTFQDFIEYFQNAREMEKRFSTLDRSGNEGEIQLHAGTYESILRALQSAGEFFDIPNCKELEVEDILQAGKLSVIDVAEKNSKSFGSVLLRDLISKVYEAKSKGEYDTKVLVIIDEVHEFYRTEASEEALEDLNAVCRKGRSLEIGVIFASQNPQDMPEGLQSIVNTIISFRTDTKPSGLQNIQIRPQFLKVGFAMANINDLPQLTILKFPLALAGVTNG